MDIERLKKDLKTKDISVDELRIKMTKSGCPVTNSTIYKKLRKEQEFTAKQIKAIIKVMGYDPEEVVEIFFNEKVS